MRENQTGSIKTFFLIGIILTCVLIGSIFYLKNRGESALIAQKETKSQQTKETTKSDKESAGNSKEKPAVKATESTNTSDDEVVASDLPTTGPESTALEAVILFASTFLVTTFVQSTILKPVRSSVEN